ASSFALVGTPDHSSAGETLPPSLLCRTGIIAPSSNDGLFTEIHVVTMGVLLWLLAQWFGAERERSRKTGRLEVHPPGSGFGSGFVVRAANRSDATLASAAARRPPALTHAGNAMIFSLFGLFTVFFIAASAAMILIILVQRPQGGGLATAFGGAGGGNDTAF